MIWRVLKDKYHLHASRMVASWIISLADGDTVTTPFSYRLSKIPSFVPPSLLYLSQAATMQFRALIGPALLLAAVGSNGAPIDIPVAEYYQTLSKERGTVKVLVCKHENLLDCKVLGGAHGTCCKFGSRPAEIAYMSSGA